jgi:hypothetical protein
MKSKLIAALVALTVGAALAGASGVTTVNGDSVVVLDGATPIFADLFDAPALQTPPWVVLSGAPGPQSGGLLELHAGDLIFAPFTPGTGDTTVVFDAALADFGADSALTLLLFGQDPADLLNLTLTPTTAVLSNEAGVVSAVLLSPGATSSMVLTVSGGNVGAAINGAPVFFGAEAFGPAVALGILVTPEPASLLALVGAMVLVRRR